MCKTNVQRGIAGVMGAVLVAGNYVKLWGNPFWSGPTMALIIGALLFFMLEFNPEGAKEEPVGNIDKEIEKELKKFDSDESK
jgi:hypothetical protein